MRCVPAKRGGLAAAVMILAALGCAPAGGAEPYRPLTTSDLDLFRAAFSPVPLGPPATLQQAPLPSAQGTFPVAEPAAGNADRVTTGAGRDAPAAAPPRSRTIAKPAIKPRPKAAARRRNPMDAQAADTRIQVWPCRSGGICNWRTAPAR